MTHLAAGIVLLAVACLAVVAAAVLYRPQTARELLFIAICSALAGSGAAVALVARDRRRVATPPKVAPVSPDMSSPAGGSSPQGRFLAPLGEAQQVELWRQRQRHAEGG